MMVRTDVSTNHTASLLSELSIQREYVLDLILIVNLSNTPYLDSNDAYHCYRTAMMLPLRLPRHETGGTHPTLPSRSDPASTWLGAGTTRQRKRVKLQ